MFPDTMSQVPGSHERVGLSSQLPATERAHFEDKFKQMSGHKVQVNSRTVIPKFYSLKKKKVTEIHVRTAEIPDFLKGAMYAVPCIVFYLVFFVCLLRAGSITAGYQILHISSRFLEF